MSLLDQIQRAATSPLALGLLGGAAVGNPGFGLLLAPAISAVRQGAERDKTAAEQALEERALRLNALRRQEEGIQGLLSAMSAPRVPDTFEGPPRPGEMRETDAQQGLLRSAAQIAPAAVAQSLLGSLTPQQPQLTDFQREVIAATGEFTPESIAAYEGARKPDRRMPGVFGELQSAGIDPTRENALAWIAAKASAQGLSPQDQLAAFRLEQEQLAAGQTGAEAERQQELASIDTAALLSSGESLLENIGSLEGSFLEPGGVGIGIRRGLASAGAEIASLAGRGDVAEDLRGQVEALDKAKKDAADFVVNLAQATGANSATELNQIRESFAGLESSPAAIRAATAREIQRAIARANAQGLELPNLDRIQRLLEEFQGAAPGQPTAGQTFIYDPATGQLRPKQ